MMQNTFDPLTQDIGGQLGTVDPITADSYGLAILDKLEEGKLHLGEDFLTEFDPATNPDMDERSKALYEGVKETKDFLVSNLQKYQAYATKRGNGGMFAFEPEARARKEGMNAVELARYAVDLIQADDETFTALLEENGDAENFNEISNYVKDPEFLRKEYSKRHLLRKAGYSDRQIDAGVAEPDARKMLGADEGESEPTINAFSRWGLSTINKVERREKVVDAAVAESGKQYFGIIGDEESFEETLNLANVTDGERTLIRRIRRERLQTLKEEFSGVMPFVIRTFNTVAAEEGVTSNFKERSTQQYADLAEAVRESGKIPKEDFGKMVVAMTKVAELHGQDVDKFMSKWGRNFTRAAGELARNTGRPAEIWVARKELETVEDIIKNGETNMSLWKVTNKESGESHYTTANKNSRWSGRGDFTHERVTDKKELQEAKEQYTASLRSQQYASEIYNWREAVAKVDSDNWFVQNFVYGVTRSLPEMGAAATGIPGILLVASAQQERNKAEFRRKNPDADWGEADAAAWAGAVGYSLLNRVQFLTATKGLPNASKFIKGLANPFVRAGARVGVLGGLIGAEAVQETGQDLTFPLAVNFFSAVSDDLKGAQGFDMLPTEGVDWSTTEIGANDGELVAAIKRFPKTMLAVSPLVLAGQGGRAVLNHFDAKAYKDIFNDVELMEAYGIDPDNILKIQNLSVPDALDFIQDNSGAFLTNMSGKFEMSLSGNMDFQPGRPVVVQPRTQQAFLETQITQAEKKLLPEEQELRDYERWKARQDYQEEMAPEEDTPMGQLLTQRYGEFLEDQLREAVGGTDIGTNQIAIGRVEAQVAFRDRLAELEDQQMQESQVVDQQSVAADQQRAQNTVGFNAEIIAQDNGTFTVTNGDVVVQARSIEEAAEAVQQLDPDFAARVEQNTQQLNDQTPMEFGAEFYSLMGPDIALFSDDTIEPSMVKKEGLPPTPVQGSDTVGAKARFRYGLQKLFGQRPLPSKTLSKTLREAQGEINGVAAMFDGIARSLDKKIKTRLKATPDALRDGEAVRLQDLSFKALRGDQDAFDLLPKNIQKDIKVGRDGIDKYSKLLIETGAVDGDLADTVGGRVGSYVLRQFKVFDPKSNWKYNYVKNNKPDIYKKGFDEIKEADPTLTDKEVDQVIEEILDPTRAEDFYIGQSKVGKFSVTSFFKQKDLSPAMLDLLGEIRNPAVNIAESGKKASSIAINYAAQLRMKKQLIDLGVASQEKNATLGHTYQLAQKKGETISSLRGLEETWVNPFVGKEFDAYFEPINRGNITPENLILKSMAGATSIGKYAQVILNPASYPTNFMGGLSTEIFNGRVSWDAKGAKAYLNNERFRNASRDDTKAYGPLEQETFRNQKNSAVLKAGGVNSIPLVSITAELQQGGVLDSNVIAGDLKAAHEASFGSSAKGVKDLFSKLYQVPDNRIKHSAFVHELNKYIRAYPNETIGQAVRRALVDTKATTQNYDMVQKFIKRLSSHGMFLPTYVSYRCELIRNTINTVKLGFRELSSGNAELQKAGAKRVAGVTVTTLVLQQLVGNLSEWFSELTEEQREKFKALKEPWLEGKNIVFLPPGEDGAIRYFDPEYMVPQTMFYNALDRGREEMAKGNFLYGLATPIKEVGEEFLDVNIFTKVAAQSVANTDQYGRDIYNSETDALGDKTEKIAGHVYKNMFTPGFLRTMEKIRKANEGEVGFAGSTSTWDDLALNLIGIRPYQKDSNDERFVVDPLQQYNGRRQKISSEFTKAEEAELKELTAVEAPTKDQRERIADLEEEKQKEEKANKRLLEEFKADVEFFRVINISEERIKDAMKKAKVPSDLRDAVKD